MPNKRDTGMDNNEHMDRYEAIYRFQRNGDVGESSCIWVGISPAHVITTMREHGYEPVRVVRLLNMTHHGFLPGVLSNIERSN